MTAKVNNSLENKKNVRAEQINVKIFLVLNTSSSQVEHIFIFDIMKLHNPLLIGIRARLKKLCVVINSAANYVLVARH